MDKKRQILVLSLFVLVLSAVSVFAQGQFDPVFGLLKNLDPLYIYGILPSLIDFTILFAIFFTVSRMAFLQRFGGPQANPMIVAVAIALAGGGVMFLRSRSLTLFSLLGNFSFFLFILLLGLFIYWSAGEPKGSSHGHVYKKAAVFLLVILVLFKAFFASQWNDLFPSQTLRGLVDLLIAIGGLMFIIFGSIEFFKGIRGSFKGTAAGVNAPNTGLFDIRPTQNPFQNNGGGHGGGSHDAHAPSGDAHGGGHAPGHSGMPHGADPLKAELESHITMLDRLASNMQSTITNLNSALGNKLVHSSQLSPSVVQQLHAFEKGTAYGAQLMQKIYGLYNQYAHAGVAIPHDISHRFALSASTILPLIAEYRKVVGRIVP